MSPVDVDDYREWPLEQVVFEALFSEDVDHPTAAATLIRDLRAAGVLVATEAEICHRRGHQADDNVLTSIPPKFRCKWCGTVYWTSTVFHEGR